jgi:hypothetical protein
MMASKNSPTAALARAIARLAGGVFCLASGYFAFLRKHQTWNHSKGAVAVPGAFAEQGCLRFLEMNEF